MKKTLTTAMMCFNEETWIARAIECVLQQSRQPDKFIIVDDASTDRSFEIIKSYAEKNSHIVCFRNETNQGVVRSLEILLGRIESDYIHFTAADDMIMPELYEVSMRMLEANPQAGACSALAVEIDREDRNTGLSHVPVVSKVPRFIAPREAIEILKKYGNWAEGTSTIWKRQSIPEKILCTQKFGPYVDSIAYLLIALTQGVCYVPRVLSRWRAIGEGFATDVLSDPEKYQYYFGNVLRYLQTEVADIFPDEYVRNWKDWNNYTHNHLVLLKRYHTLAGQQAGSMERKAGAKRLAAFAGYQWNRLGLVFRYRIYRPPFLRHKLSYLKNSRLAKRIETRSHQKD